MMEMRRITQDVPRGLEDAARVDGVTTRKRFRLISICLRIGLE